MKVCFGLKAGEVNQNCLGSGSNRCDQLIVIRMKNGKAWIYGHDLTATDNSTGKIVTKHVLIVKIGDKEFKCDGTNGNKNDSDDKVDVFGLPGNSKRILRCLWIRSLSGVHEVWSKSINGLVRLGKLDFSSEQRFAQYMQADNADKRSDKLPVLNPPLSHPTDPTTLCEPDLDITKPPKNYGPNPLVIIAIICGIVILLMINAAVICFFTIGFRGKSLSLSSLTGSKSGSSSRTARSQKQLKRSQLDSKSKVRPKDRPKLIPRITPVFSSDSSDSISVYAIKFERLLIIFSFINIGQGSVIKSYPMNLQS